MNIKRILYYRAKKFVDSENRRKSFAGNNLDYKYYPNIPLELSETMETIKNYKSKSNVLLDIGAHNGLFSKMANLIYKFDKTFCFEPNQVLNKTIRLNNSNENVIIENIALSDSDGQTTFYLHTDSSMNSIVEAREDLLKMEFPWDDPSKMKKETVSTATLDNYISKNTSQKDIFFIKIDTQGNELNILKNGISTLKRTEICLIEFMFTNPYQSDFRFYDLISFMEKSEFDCMGALTINKRPSMKVSAVDFLFVKRKL
jgi:FkbM family methyltransferase